MLRQFRLSVCPSVRPSVTRVLCVKTAERITEILSLSDRPTTKGRCVNLTALPTNGGAEYKGVAIFDKYAAISRKR